MCGNLEKIIGSLVFYEKEKGEVKLAKRDLVVITETSTGMMLAILRDNRMLEISREVGGLRYETLCLSGDDLDTEDGEPLSLLATMMVISEAIGLGITIIENTKNKVSFYLGKII